VILSHDNYILFVSLMTGLVAAYWVVVDSYRLYAAWRDPDDHPAVRRDRLFGSSLGIVIGVMGVAGVLAYHYG